MSTELIDIGQSEITGGSESISNSGIYFLADTTARAVVSNPSRKITGKFLIDHTAEATQESCFEQPTGQDRKNLAKAKLDSDLLDRAVEIVEQFQFSEVVNMTVDFEALEGIVIQLWKTATKSSEIHQEVLGLLQLAISSVGLPNKEEASFFREALIDLRQSVLTQGHIDVLRARYLSIGFGALPMTADVE